MHAFERGRITGINGMVSELTLHPEHLGPRIKKNVIRMLENAHITGGWSSQSRQVAETLAQRFNLSVLQTRWQGLTLYAQPRPEIRDQLIELIHADIAAFLLENPGYHTSYYANAAQEAIAQLKKGNAKYIDFRSGEFSKRAITLINSELPAHVIAQNKHVIDLLNSNTPIRITTIRS